MTFGLTFAIWLSQSLRFVDLIVNKGLPISTFLYLASLLLPRFLIIVLPIAMFCAVLFVYNRLSNDSELVVMRAVGMGQAELARPALMVACAVAAILYSLSLYLLPVSYRAFKDLYNDLRGEYYSLVLQEGKFQELVKGITVYIRERDRNGALAGIVVHDNRDRDRPVTYMAETGALVAEAEAVQRVVLIKGNRQSIDRKTKRLSILYFDRYMVEIDLKRPAAGNRWRDPRERFVNELFYPDDSEADRKYAKEIRAEGHQRVIGPLSAVTMTLIALACLLYGDFNRRGQVGRVLLAIMLAILVQAASFGLQNIAAKHSVAVPFMYLVAVGPMVLSGFFMRHRPRPAQGRPPADALAPG